METLSATTVDHYRRVGPWIARHLAGVPLVTAFYADGDVPTFAASLHGAPPGNEATVDVTAASGRVRYLALTPTSMLYEAHRGAMEVHSWSPRGDDPARTAFARVLVRPEPDRRAGYAVTAARGLRAELTRRKLDGIVMRDGAGTVCVWIPFSDGPAYAELRVWLHGLVAACVAADADLRAHEFHVTSNAVGHWSMAPYSVIGPGATTVVTPVRWDELDAVGAPLAVTSFAAQMTVDVFDAEVHRIGSQRFAETAPALMVSGEGHGRVLAAVRAILADEKAHSAAEICATAIACGLLPASTIPAYVQHGIATLLDRQRDRGEKPEFVLLADGTYRLNVPVNPFAGHVEPPHDRTALDALIARLRAAVVRDVPADPSDGPNIGAPFERAVADALAYLGLTAQRLGGEGEPDVVAFAPLGVEAYRVAFECKTVASVKLHGSAGFVAEAARMRDAIGAQYAVLLGLDFPDERGINDELATHRVALWTLEDLISVLECQLDHPIMWSRLVPLFAAGRVADALVAWRAEHLHGEHQRAHIVLRYVMEEGLAYQESLGLEAIGGDGSLTVDALVVLVNQRLQREGNVARCSGANVTESLRVLTSSLLGAGNQTSTGGIVIERRLGPTSARVG